MFPSYPEAELLPGLVVFRFDAPLFFANTRTFREQVVKLGIHGPSTSLWIVIAAEPITDVDTTAADTPRIWTKPSTPVACRSSSQR